MLKKVQYMQVVYAVGFVAPCPNDGCLWLALSLVHVSVELEVVT